MKIYLLNPPFFPHFNRSPRWQDTGRGGTMYYPIWLSYAAAILSPDHDIRLADAPVWNWDLATTLEDIKRFGPDLVILDTSFPSLKNDLSVAKAIKEESDAIKTAVVGPPASQYTEGILKSGSIDYVARWEYDFTLQELARLLEVSGNVADVAGISYLRDGRAVHNPDRVLSASADLDRIPFVSKIYQEHLHIDDYFLGQSLYPEVQ
ncbi:MAG TPA: cobalamin-dependent protein, partial [Methanomicrobiales archaeon]|nr:cobalamin-dependent protein [Methanomicrobiales archaeon]